MGIYIYRLGAPKKIAGKEIGTMTYWDKLSLYGHTQRPLCKELDNLPAGRLYVEFEEKLKHGSRLLVDTWGGYNHWNDCDEDRFEVTGEVLVKHRGRWVIVSQESYEKSLTMTEHTGSIA